MLKPEPGSPENTSDNGLKLARPTHVVGVGASAGGLEALESMFANIRPDTGMAFVVIQHLSPDFKSMMDELLRRRTQMKIHRVEDGMTVQANCIYLIPPKKEMIISGGNLLLTDKDPDDGLSLPIDTFFRSLARDSGESAIAIILSGTGSDGSRGLVDVNDQGGLVVVQTPEMAQFDGMPKAAIDTGCADIVIDAKAIGATLDRFVHGRKLMTAVGVPDDQVDPMLRIFALLRDRFSLDFAAYKTNTVARRIQRRLQMMRDETLDNYAKRLEQDDQELDSLYRDLLIGVTQFFRDADAFTSLQRRVISEVVNQKNGTNEIRVWVASCATGEEAYSVAMLLDEEAEQQGFRGEIKIFATDVHRGSIEFASEGKYSSQQLQGLSRDRLEKYFTRNGDIFQVTSKIRQMVILASHNVLRDAPFTKVDLVTCRNMLIYLRPEAQRKVLSLFHFGLRSGGFLMLGSSESPGDLSDEFEKLDSRWKIYRKRRDVSLLSDIQLSVPRNSSNATSRERGRGQQVAPTARLSERQVIAAYEHVARNRLAPSFVVRPNGDLVYVMPGGSTYLKNQEGFPRANCLDLVERDLRTAISGLLPRALREEKAVSFCGVKVYANSELKIADISVSPVRLPDINEAVLIVTVDISQQHQTSAPTTQREAASLTAERIDILEAELRYTRENLQATIQELETSNEELQAANEELIASNEELQSTNEELHSVNEELHTVNSEHTRKIDELTRLTEDMENLVEATDTVTMFLDKQLNIRRFAPGAEQLFHVTSSDIGRKLEAFNHSLNYPDLIGDIQKVTATNRAMEKEVSNDAGDHFLVKISPYVSHIGAQGTVLSLVNLAPLKAAREELEASETLFRGMFENSAVGIARLDLHGRWLNLNHRLCELLGFESEDVQSCSFRQILQADETDFDACQFDQLLRGEIERFTVQKSYTSESRTPVWINVTAALQRDDNLRPLYCMVVIQDITPRKEMENQLKNAIVQRDRFLATLSHELRNPLSALLHAANLINRRRRGTKRSDQPIDVIVRQSQQMSHLLDDLLDVSRITQNKFSLNRATVNIVDLAREAAEAVLPSLERKQQQFKFVIDNKPIWVFADSTRILQSIENLLSNASRYTPEGGRIEMRVAQNRSEAVITVTDTGQGLAPDMLEEIFEMFVQTSGNEASPSEGMGLGLTLTRSFIELHGGSVTAKSDGKDRGCQFEIRVPVTKKRLPEQSPPTRPTRRVRSVVLVEDEEDARDMIAESLRLDGYKVTVAADGDQGLATILHERPEVAIVDISLPGMNGYDIAAQVRKTLPSKETKLVAMTGFGRDSDRQKALQAGFDEHLVKPASSEAIERVLTRKEPDK